MEKTRSDKPGKYLDENNTRNQNIIITGRTVEEVNEQMNILANALLSWVDSNGLALNLKKTKYMMFSRQRIDSTYRLEFANTQIERKTESAFLGVIVDFVF